MKKYRLLKDFPGVKAGNIIDAGNFGVINCMVESHPDFFEEIKEPQSYFYINDRLEIVEESYPREEYDEDALTHLSYKNGSDYWKWQRIKAGNCFETRKRSEWALQNFKYICANAYNAVLEEPK